MESMVLTERKYAGFWIRFVASLIDGFVLGIPLFFLQMFINLLILAPVIGNQAQMITANMAVMFVNGVLSTVVAIVYYGMMESSSQQATHDKMVIGVKVADENGGRLSLRRVLLRYIGKFLSAILYIGDIMVAFTERKHALHDFITKTYVVYK
ncbi:MULTISPECIES: RDD family protein [Bacillaceae]|uniref:RDD family protein n=1 Tax=Bacillaceae TaxID=186817 RepID=UPI000693745A|nr:RDD family protein [Bacillus rubiinfantis]